MSKRKVKRRPYCGWTIRVSGKRGDIVSLGISDFPYRKHVALYGGKGNSIYPLAYFRSEAAAREAVALLEMLVQPIPATSGTSSSTTQGVVWA